MIEADFSRVSPIDRPDYRSVIVPVSQAVWPEFMHHDPVAIAHWDGLYDHFSAYQFALLDKTGFPAAIANSVPLAWDGRVEDLPDEGWDWALTQSAEDHARDRPMRTLCAIQIAIHPRYQGQRLSGHVLQLMASLAEEQGLKRLIVPVRPSLKDRYPPLSMSSYITWTNDWGEPFDPWLRVHVRHGGRIVRVCDQAFRAVGSVADWTRWTGLSFQESGEYIVPGGLRPVRVDLDADLGEYVEPNVWVLHPRPHGGGGSVEPIHDRS